MNHRKPWLALPVAAAVVSSMPVAPPAFSETLEEVLVTARRREETLQSTPISVTAFSAQTLEQRGIEDVTDLSNFVPNLNLLSSTSFGGSDTAFAFIRGVGQPEVFVQNDPGVGIYVDGVYFGRSQGAIFDLVDMKRVEVLRGPQGTLYGRNTIGGAINLISAPPSEEAFVRLQLEAGNYDTRNGKLKVNGPLTDSLFASATVSVRRHDGYAEAEPHPVCISCSRDDLTDEDTTALRAALRYLPSEMFTLDLAVDYTRKDQRPIGRRLAVSENGFPPYDIAVFAQWGVFPSAFETDDYNTHSSNFTGQDEQDIWGLALTAEWKLDDDTSIKSITGYRELDIDHASDSDGSPQVINTIIAQELEQDQFSQELQYHAVALNDRLDWLVGAFYMTEDANDSINQAQSFAEGFFVPNPLFDPLAPPLFGLPPRGADVTDYQVDSWAVFAHGSYQLTERFSVSAGARYSYEEKDFKFNSVAFGTSFDLDADWDEITPRLGIEFQLTEDIMFYGSYSEGFKSGSFNNGNDPLLPLIVEPEEVEAFEIGAKTAWWDNRATVNVALFWSDYTNQQLQVRTNTLAQTFAFVNVGESEIKGAELEFSLLAADSLRFDGGIGYTDSEITEVDVNTPNVKKGAELVRTPELDVSLGASWTVQLGAAGGVELRADYAYKSEQQGDFVNHPNAEVDAYDITHFRATYMPADGDWNVYTFVNNAFDEEYETARAGFDPEVSAGAVDGPPRTYGVGVRVTF